MKYGASEKKEVMKHLKPYMDDVKETKDLRKCCERCEEYMGAEHDYGECENCPILQLWYETEWWRWCGSWEGCHDMNY